MGTLDLTATLVALIRGLEENIVLIDNKGSIIHATKGANELVHEEEISGRTIFDFISGSGSMERVKNWLANLSDAHFKDVRIHILRNGKPFPARLRMAAWPTGGGEFIILAAIVDSTFIEQKKRDLLRKALSIEYLSRSTRIRSGELHEAIYEILSLSSRAVNVERVNAWLYDEDSSKIKCIGNFDTKENGLIPQESLPRIDMPNYFKAFESTKIILTEDSRNSELTRELLDSYLIPNDIHSMMDIPIRSEGAIIGVICFEQVGHQREWNLQDQKFGLIAAQLVSLAVETHKRKVVEQQLEHSARQKELLMIESNHRIKNNLTVIIGMMRMQLEKCKDEYHRCLMQDSLNRMYSIVSLHNLLTESENRVNFSSYVRKLTGQLKESLTTYEKEIQLISDVPSCELSSELAVTLGLIITEVVTNSYKHAFLNTNKGAVRVNLDINGSTGLLSIADTGSGSDPETEQNGLGIEIVNGLVENINGKLSTSRQGGYSVDIEFPMQ